MIERLADYTTLKVGGPAQVVHAKTEAEIIEAIFGQGEYFDIKDDVQDIDGNPIDVGKLREQLLEDFAKASICADISISSSLAITDSAYRGSIAHTSPLALIALTMVLLLSIVSSASCARSCRVWPFLRIQHLFC